MGKGKLVKFGDKYPNYFINDVTKIIYYRCDRKGPAYGRFSTGQTQIGKARKVVEVKLAKLHSSNVNSSKRKSLGIKNPSIKDLWDEIVSYKTTGKSDRTKRAYRNTWDHSLEFFWANKRINDLNEDFLEHYYKEYLKIHPERLFDRTRIHFQFFINELYEKGLLVKKLKVKDLDETIKRNIQYEKVGRVYTKHEVKKMLIEAKSRGLKYYIIVLLGLHGLRKMEALSLKKSNIFLDFRSPYIKAWSNKNANWRDIPIKESLRHAFVQYFNTKDLSNTEWVFPKASDPAKHIYGQMIDSNWVKIKIAAGISGATEYHKSRFHDLRHTFATQTAKDKWNPLVACKVLDMSLEIYEKVYCHVNFEMKVEAMNSLKDFGNV